MSNLIKDETREEHERFFESGLAQGGLPVDRPDPDPLFPSESQTSARPDLSYAPVLALFADQFLRRENGEKTGT